MPLRRSFLLILYVCPLLGEVFDSQQGGSPQTQVSIYSPKIHHRVIVHHKVADWYHALTYFALLLHSVFFGA